MKKKDKLVDKLFLIILSVQTILMGILFTTQVCRIYFVEEHYTREIAIKYLMEILAPMIIWVVMIIASFIYFYIVNRKDKNRTRLLNIVRLKTLTRLMPEKTEENASDYKLVMNEERNRLIAKIINIVVLGVSSLMGLLYLINPSHFSGENPTGNVVSMSLCLLPWVIVSLVSSLISVFYIDYSAKKEMDLIKGLIKSTGKQVHSYKANKKLEIGKLCATYSILIAAIVLIIVGVFDGSAKSVLIKAILICTECIGLG